MNDRSQCPHVRNDQSVNLLRFGYLTMSRLRRMAGVSARSHMPVRLKALGKPATLLRGSDGVDAFYDTTRMQRTGAMPPFIQVPLFGEGAVHTLDDDAHRTRKSQLVDAAYPDEKVDEFATIVEEELDSLVGEWQAHQHTTVHEGTALAFGRAAFRWAGLDLSSAQADEKSRQMTQLLDGFGRIGVDHLKARLNRRRLDQWAGGLIHEVRAGERHAPEGSALAAMAALRDDHGQLVDEKTAGIELQNLTRPTVAVARFASFAAVAITENPQWAEKIQSAVAEADGRLIGIREAIVFAQEVRRVYPFVPALPALAREDTNIQGCPVGHGERVVIDILGTNTDPNEWDNAATFDPDRFFSRSDLNTLEDYEKINSFIPQGGKDVRTGHRCPGEKIAVTALSATVALLCIRDVRISTESEDLTFDWTKVLTRPSTGVRVAVGD